MKAFLRIFALALKIVGWLLVIGAPVLGVWVASSLAAYLNGPIWLACVAGLFLFPVVPLTWDLWGTKRFARKQEQRREAGKEPRERILTFWDRMITRTFIVNVVFLGTLLTVHPQAGFTALATRGDWFLDEAEHEVADQIRPLLFESAESLVWLYEWSSDNPFEEWESDEPLPTPTADEFGDSQTRVDSDDETGVETPELEDSTDTRDDAEDDDEPREIEIVGINSDPPDSDESPRPAGEPPKWPMKAELHPAVKEMPKSVETDYGAVARYIADREDDPFLRVKALNDWAADRIAYDVPSLRAGDYPPQDAKSVFDRRMAVCAGYARLVEAMAKVTGDDVVYITGVSRDRNGGVAGGGHAWNAAKIEGKWYLIDATWNAGYVDDEGFQKKYETNYLFTPPHVFSMDHLPNEESWQLRKDPITRGEFVRQPMMRSEFYAQGLELVTPKRSQIEARNGEVEVRLKNPKARKVIASITPTTGGEETRCTSRGRGDVRVLCKPPGDGTYNLQIFAGNPGLTYYPFVGQFEVIAR